MAHGEIKSKTKSPEDVLGPEQRVSLKDAEEKVLQRAAELGLKTAELLLGEEEITGAELEPFVDNLREALLAWHNAKHGIFKTS